MSEKGTDIVAGLVTKQGKNGRRSYSVPAKQALARLCSQPGVSVARTALMHGINANLLRRWIVMYSDSAAPIVRDAPSNVTSTTLLPVISTTSKTARAAVSSDSCIELIFMAATIRLHGAVDARLLGVVLDCLAQRA